jgi:hypothetical protein
MDGDMNRDIDGDMDRDGERDEDRDTEGDGYTERDRDISVVEQLLNSNISANLKPNSKIILGMNQGSMWD